MRTEKGYMPKVVVATVLSVTAAYGQETASVYHTARAIVQTGQSAGVIVALDMPSREGGLGPVISLQEQSARVAHLPALAGSATSMLSRHAKGGRIVDDQTATLIDSQAHGCIALLDTPVQSEIHGGLFKVAVEAFNSATGQAVPATGWIGLGGSGGTGAVDLQRLIHVSDARDLRTALESAVMAVPGSLWLAVQDQSGRCGIGLMLRGDAGEPLLLQIGVAREQ